MKKEITVSEFTILTLTKSASEIDDSLLEKMIDTFTIPSFMIEKMTYPKRIIKIERR